MEKTVNEHEFQRVYAIPLNMNLDVNLVDARDVVCPICMFANETSKVLGEYGLRVIFRVVLKYADGINTVG